MRILKWTPNFHVDIESSIVPAWILLPKLPAHLMNVDILREIIASFGNLLRVDASTASLKRPSIARVQVEIDLLKPFPKRLWIQQGDLSGFWQILELERDLPQYCTYYCHIGHEEDYCLVKNPTSNRPENSTNRRQEEYHRARNSGPPAQIWKQKQHAMQPNEQPKQQVEQGVKTGVDGAAKDSFANLKQTDSHLSTKQNTLTQQHQYALGHLDLAQATMEKGKMQLEQSAEAGVMPINEAGGTSKLAEQQSTFNALDGSQLSITILARPTTQENGLCAPDEGLSPPQNGHNTELLALGVDINQKDLNAADKKGNAGNAADISALQLSEKQGKAEMNTITKPADSSLDKDKELLQNLKASSGKIKKKKNYNSDIEHETFELEKIHLMTSRR